MCLKFHVVIFFQTNLATNAFLSGNVVAGSERAAYWIDGESCDGQSESWGSNTARTSLDGIYINRDGALSNPLNIYVTN